jgi:hypothetical protein
MQAEGLLLGRLLSLKTLFLVSTQIEIRFCTLSCLPGRQCFGNGFPKLCLIVLTFGAGLVGQFGRMQVCTVAVVRRELMGYPRYFHVIDCAQSLEAKSRMSDNRLPNRHFEPQLLGRLLPLALAFPKSSSGLPRSRLRSLVSRVRFLSVGA